MKKYITGFLVLLFIAVFLVGCAPKTKVYQPQGQAPAVQPSSPAAVPSAAPSAAAESAPPEAAPSVPTAVEATMPEIRNCESDYAIGWVPNSCTYSKDSFKIVLKAVGKNGIDGVAFYIIGKTGVQKILKDNTKVPYPGVQGYSFSITELESKVGGKIEQILALPIKNVDGVEKACYNHRLLIIKDEACRA